MENAYMPSKEILLGSKYRDKVTGYVGTAIGVSTWMTGCKTVGVQGPMDKDGKVPDCQWVDELRLELTEEKAPIDPGSTLKGGPQPTPQRSMAGF